jgi:CSLREA domain-containing protein
MAACDDEKPTPTAPSDPERPAFDHIASHLVVNSVADPGTGGCTPEECTLREAITAANQDPDPSEISFARKFTAAIRLDAASGQLEITEDLSISGPNGGIVIQRSSGDPGFRIFDISKDPGTATVRFTHLTIRGGQSATGGGGIRNGENLTLANSIVSDNAAATSGGGIFNGGELTLMNSTVSGNSASISGGGIAGFSGTITLINSTISGNQVTGTSGAGGGGIRNQDRLTLIGSTVSGNSSSVAGGGISNFGETVFENSATVTNSTVSGNSAGTVGGGIYTGNSDPSRNSFLTLLNSTVVGNSAASQGGGINQDVNSLAAFTSLTNSLLALNMAPSAPDVFATFCSSGPCDARFNLIGIGDGATGVTHGVDGNQVGTTIGPINPNVGPLAGNGGATQTHALKPGSPAIDAASTLASPSTDQRGLLRPQGPASDIGSYERQVKGAR